MPLTSKVELSAVASTGYSAGTSPPLSRSRRALVAVLLAILTVAGCGEAIALPQRTAPVAPAAAGGDAAGALDALPVKGRAPKSGYSRAEFGQRWKDIDHNGCDQRNDVLARDLEGETLRGRCVVLTGTLHDPYSGTTIEFRRGEGTSDDVQVDHVVALSNAWQTGAQQLSVAERELLGNDPLNLLAVDGATNAAKGDADAATWLPPVRGYRCAYVARQVAVKAIYRLWVTPAERDAMVRVLAGCPGQPLPASGAPR